MDFSLNWEVYPTTDDSNTVKKIISENHSCYIHSFVSPKKEAERWAALVQVESEILVVFGFGLGYHLLELQKINPSTTVLIIEADLELFKLAINLSNLAPIIQNPKIHLLIGEKISEIKDFFNNFSQSSISYKEYLPSTCLHPEYYQSIKEMLEDYIYKNRLMNNPVLSQGIITLLEETKR